MEKVFREKCFSIIYPNTKKEGAKIQFSRKRSLPANYSSLPLSLYCHPGEAQRSAPATLTGVPPAFYGGGSINSRPTACAPADVSGEDLPHEIVAVFLVIF